MSHLHRSVKAYQPRLLGNANDTACWTSTGVSSLLGLLVAALAKVIGASMNHDGALCWWSVIITSSGSDISTYTNDTLLADELDEAILDRALGVSLTVGLEISQVTYVTLAVGWCTMSLAEGVDCSRSAVSI